MKPFRKNHGGWTALAAIAVLASTAIGAGFAYAVLLCFDHSSPPMVSWTLLAVFGIPLSYATVVYNELGKLLEVHGLSASERRRIAATVAAKQRQAFITICFFGISTFLLAFGLMAASADWGVFNVVIVVQGGFIGIAAASIPLLFLQMKEVAGFKARVVARANRRKIVHAKLGKLVANGR